MAVPVKPGMAGLYGGAGPTGYVNNLYGPQEHALAQQQAARADTFRALVTQILGALPTPAQASAPYSAAIADTNQLARASADRLAAANPDAQTQANLAAINAPQAQRDAVSAHNQTVFGGGAGLLGFTGGAIPSGVFAGDAAGRNAYISSLPAVVGLGAQQGLGHLDLLASQENAQLAGQKAQAQQQAVSALADYMTKKQSNKISEAAVLGNLLGYVPPGLLGNKTPVGTLAGKRLVAQNAQANARIGISKQNANTSASRATQAQIASDRAYSLALTKYYGIDLPRLKLAQTKATAATKSGGLSASKKAQIAEKAARDAEDLYHGTTRPNPQDPNNPTVLTYSQTYQDAIKTLLNRYPSLGAQGVLKLVNQWYQPGQYGRPLGAAPPIKFFSDVTSFVKKAARVAKGKR